MIQPATPEDLDRLLPMVNALSAHHGDPEACTREALERDLFGPDAFVTVLLAEAGYTTLYPTAQLHWGVRGMEMHHLFVHPHQRGTGLGKALVLAAVAHAKTQGARYLSLGTHPDNAKARDFYAALGFEVIAPGPRLRLKF
ncbi:GNAT family N-acetyltransferase [Pararhodobacter zhoushanensis]|uniref:GNAT family N-acetyltransferase n=1 Tax=Pararhodobacter zhoushanensis TaxID=2479545 RepID=A0ABT3H2E8_9RHOB|nr:GNAT family N-acetyltransferase [Pararhodobacter zhoushanensis]MCW1933868.1 GNAT family N-acetyltransferase [Pararhodobacter zhoushanensis]